MRILCLCLAITFTIASHAAETEKVTFVRDVMPILNKTGCTSGPCHGSAKGKNGFKLSLRGYDPEFDYRAIVHELSGRRFNRTDPAQSLVLLKPIMGVPHGGGLRFDQDHPYYRTMLRWIEQGVDYGNPVSAQVVRVEVTPAELKFEKKGASQQLRVIAHFADNATRDVTRDAQYTSNTPVVADVGESGLVQTERKGEAALLVRYEGRLAVVPITVLTEKTGFVWKPMPETGLIDRFVNAKLERVRILPSDVASDAEFLRRASLDLIGLPPTTDEVKAFLKDADPAKRTKLVDRLMARTEFVNHWSVKWSDLLQVNRARLGDKGMWAFREWIRESLAVNKPYDVMARELLTARGSTFQNPPANFFRFTRDPKVSMETTTQLFLGVRMVCAQCHDHPFEQWTQNQYFHLSAFFGSVGIKEGADSGEEVIFEKREDNQIKHPKDGRIMSPKFLYGAESISPGEANLRQSLAEWVTSPKNRLFGKAMANRVWSYFFGHGIIDPVDDIRASNPPTNAALLEALTDDFINSKYDLRRLIRTIATSTTYQLNFRTNEWNAEDELNFSHFIPRRLNAEQLFDAVYVAAGVAPYFGDVPRGFKAQDLPDPTIGKGGFLDLFGRPERQTSCECERRSDLSLVQAMNLLNGATLADAIAAEDGRVARLIGAGKTDRQIVEELYIAALNRLPNGQELDQALTYVGGGLNRAERAQDLLWALLNSNAFLFNR